MELFRGFGLQAQSRLGLARAEKIPPAPIRLTKLITPNGQTPLEWMGRLEQLLAVLYLAQLEWLLIHFVAGLAKMASAARAGNPAPAASVFDQRGSAILLRVLDISPPQALLERALSL